MDLRPLMAIPRQDLGAGTGVRVRVGGGTECLARWMAEEMARTILENNRAGKPTCLIVPVGPVDQYEPLARILTEEKADCRRVTFINMDEFLGDERDAWIEPDHPLSFRGFMERSFYDRLPPAAHFAVENRVFPDPRDPGAVSALIADRGGVDVCFGGIGLNGHVAFNEPEAVSEEEFRARPARVLDIAPESRAHMAINLSCALDLIPRRAVTLGMREILGARRLSLYANRPWQCGVIRQALHGPLTPHCPASFVRTHPEASLTLADFVAEPKEVRLR